MKTLLTEQELIDFEEDIANSFKNKKIKSPIHLDFDCEQQMIEIFKDVEPEDWVFGTWRSHYISLLKGVPKKELKRAIINNRSISLCFRKYNIVSSAIVGGNLSIALGMAMDIKRKKQNNKVWCFLGDMTSFSGQFLECFNYARNFELPITFVVCDNNKSVVTDTRKTIGNWKLPIEPELSECFEEKFVFKSKYLYYFKYDLSKKYPHSGPGGQRISF